MHHQVSQLIAKLRLPLIVAPLSGGPTTPQLVAASSKAGALGSLGAAYLTPAQIERDVATIRTLTSNPFAINLFAPQQEQIFTTDQLQSAIQATSLFRTELGLPAPTDFNGPFHPNFTEQFEAVIRSNPAVFSFVFGLIPSECLRECRDKGILTIGTATTLEEGLELEASGVDAVVAQGYEAGGHRGIFDPKSSDPAVPTIPLTQTLASRLKIPVIAAGGLMDGAAIRSALNVGAEAVQMGTAFLLCDEAGTSGPYRKALEKATGKDTTITRTFSGRWARGIKNRFVLEFQGKNESILPFPAQNAFTRDVRGESAKRGSSEYLSLWAGTGVDHLRGSLSASQLIDALEAELRNASKN